ncbi:MAG: hypothetical protein RL204_630 [Bacteroidota bacterium]|jgi:hypothetical protein
MELNKGFQILESKTIAHQVDYDGITKMDYVYEFNVDDSTVNSIELKSGSFHIFFDLCLSGNDRIKNRIMFRRQYEVCIDIYENTKASLASSSIDAYNAIRKIFHTECLDANENYKNAVSAIELLFPIDANGNDKIQAHFDMYYRL